MHQILVQLRVTTVHLDNTKKKIHKRLAKHARKDLPKYLQPVAQFVSQAPIKTQSLSVKTAPLAIISRLQDRCIATNVHLELLLVSPQMVKDRATTVPRDIFKEIPVKQAVHFVRDKRIPQFEQANALPVDC
tara:strand:+ start:478 stop:873 length:396 start_codon:yes stop_codon:yes gene_type:complete